jgi:hypothetical protein
MSDNDFMKRVAKSHERWTGQEWSPEKTLENFPLYGKAKRIEALEQIDAAVEAANPEGNLREYARLTRLQREVQLQHELMLKNGR